LRRYRRQYRNIRHLHEFAGSCLPLSRISIGLLIGRRTFRTARRAGPGRCRTGPHAPHRMLRLLSRGCCPGIRIGLARTIPVVVLRRLGQSA
jgi:hypothetical protein